MSSIKMAKLDFLTAKNQAKGFIAAVLFIIVFLAFTSGSFLSVGITSAWVVALFGTMTFMVQETNGLERFYNTVPMKIKDVVAGRYISTIALYLATHLVSIVVFMVVALFSDIQISASDIAIGMSLSVLAFAVITAIQTPFFFKLGYMKGRLYSIVALMAMILLFILPSFIPALAYPVELLAAAMSNYLPVVCLVIAAVVIYVSYRASIAAYVSKR